MFWRKVFRLPGPQELGWADDNFLESRDFSDNPQGKTWEEWHEFVKEHYPVRYFFAETLTDFIMYRIWLKISTPVSRAWYWLKCHTLPSYRFHFLDLRQPDWRYGWCDVPEKMLYAMFNLLKEYLDEEPYDLTESYTREAIAADPALRRQQEALDEARMLHQWWIVGRCEEQQTISEMRTKWYDSSKNNHPDREIMWKTLRQMEDSFEEKTDEMIARLMKIRRTLWT